MSTGSPDLHAQIDPYDYYEAMLSGSRAEQAFHRARLDLVLKATQWKGRRVLDLGAGAGAFSIPLAEAGAEVWAVELSADHCATLKARAEERGLPITVLQADASALPFPDDHFDAVLAASLVHLVPFPAPILREAERVCTRDGRIVVAGPWRFHPKSMPWVKKLLGKSVETKSFPFEIHRLGRLMIRSVLIDRHVNYPMGYVASVWVPSGK